MRSKLVKSVMVLGVIGAMGFIQGCSTLGSVASSGAAGDASAAPCIKLVAALKACESAPGGFLGKTACEATAKTTVTCN